MSKGNIERLVAAALAAAQVITAGTALADVLGNDKAALVALVVGAIQVGVAVYRGQAPAEPADPLR